MALDCLASADSKSVFATCSVLAVMRLHNVPCSLSSSSSSLSFVLLFSYLGLLSYEDLLAVGVCGREGDFQDIKAYIGEA